MGGDSHVTNHVICLLIGNYTIFSYINKNIRNDVFAMALSLCLDFFSMYVGIIFSDFCGLLLSSLRVKTLS